MTRILVPACVSVSTSLRSTAGNTHTKFTRIAFCTVLVETLLVDEFSGLTSVYRVYPFLLLLYNNFNMATLNGIRDALSSYEPRSMIQCDVKATIAPHVMAEPQPDPKVCVSNLRADLPPELLYAREMLRGPNVLYRLIRDYLVVKGLSYTLHPTPNRFLTVS